MKTKIILIASLIIPVVTRPATAAPVSTVITERIDVPVSEHQPVAHTTIVRSDHFEFWNKETQPTLTRFGWFARPGKEWKYGGYLASRQGGDLFLNPSLTFTHRLLGGTATVWIEPYVPMKNGSPWIITIPEANWLVPVAKGIDVGPAGYIWSEEGKKLNARWGLAVRARSGEVTAYARVTTEGSKRGNWLRFQVGVPLPERK